MPAWHLSQSPEEWLVRMPLWVWRHLRFAFLLGRCIAAADGGRGIRSRFFTMAFGRVLFLALPAESVNRFFLYLEMRYYDEKDCDCTRLRQRRRIVPDECVKSQPSWGNVGRLV